MDAGWWGVLIAIAIGIPTLIYARRATIIGEEAHEYQVRLDRDTKRANLEFAPEYKGERIWRSMGKTDKQTNWFTANVRNRGPADAIDMKWSATQSAHRLKVGNSPDFLYVMQDHQCTLEVPLDSWGVPISDPIEVSVQFSDASGTQKVRWCVRCLAESPEHPEAWEMEDLDCISLLPRLARGRMVNRL